MFLPDIVTFRQFYASPLGEAVRRVLSQRMHEVWPDIAGDSLLGIGYAAPYMDAYLQQSREVFICMPAHQGAAYWPSGGGNRVLLANEASLPMAESSINRVLMVHSVENSEQLSWMMSEAWRVLTPGGRIMMLLPNRLGMWSHFSNNPFGSGRPFSKHQIRELMADHDFTVLRIHNALYMPPMHSATSCKLANWFEQTGSWLYPLWGGLLLVEAEKQVYASIRQPANARRGYHMPVRSAKPVMGFETSRRS
jgi:hypothetical protein